jgi:monofunctional biosynthetic peptidoglycan transglycosylase
VDPGRLLFDFADPARAGGFAPLDDVVMGGRSRSRATLEGGRLVFAGTVSLEDGGGFASIRSRPSAWKLGGLAGLRLWVRGDGRRYKLNLRTDPASEGVTWQAYFDTRPGAREEVDLLFGAFVPTYRGRQVPDAGPLDPARIATVGFLVADGQDGPFRLEVQAIGGFARPSAAPASGPDQAG